VFLTGHEDPAKPDAAVRWEDYGRLGATLCIYMGVRNLETIARRLRAGGLAPETPAAIIQEATTERHRLLLGTLGTLAARAREEAFEAPALVVIGEVVALADQLAWFEAGRAALAGAKSP
jgi:uroporphyrinogen III methyltransferase/synthase